MMLRARRRESIRNVFPAGIYWYAVHQGGRHQGGMEVAAGFGFGSRTASPLHRKRGRKTPEGRCAVTRPARLRRAITALSIKCGSAAIGSGAV